MQIEGPFNIKIVDNADAQSRELQLQFTQAFKEMPLEPRQQAFQQHIDELQQSIQASNDEAEQQGMMTILQIAEQLLPHIVSDEIPLEETIVIEIGPTSPLDQLLDSAKLK